MFPFKTSVVKVHVYFLFISFFSHTPVDVLFLNFTLSFLSTVGERWGVFYVLQTSVSVEIHLFVVFKFVILCGNPFIIFQLFRIHVHALYEKDL